MDMVVAHCLDYTASMREAGFAAGKG